MAGSSDPPLPPRRASRLRVSGAASWDTALVVQPDDGRGADIETVFLENDFRCVRAGDEHDPAALVLLEKPKIVVVDPADERLTGSGLRTFAAVLTKLGVPVIVLGGDEELRFGGSVAEVALERGFTPADLREAIKTARWMADNPSKGPDQKRRERAKKLKTETERYEQKSKNKARTARYAEPSASDTDHDEDPTPPERTGGPRRKRFNTTLSFKPTSVATAPSRKPLVVPPRRRVTANAALNTDSDEQDWQPVSAPGATNASLLPSADPLPNARRRLRKTTRKVGGHADRRLRRTAARPHRDSGHLDTGTLIADRYVVGGVLGTGGMATVYQCHDRELDEDVALKLVDASRGNAATLQRFRHEMRVCRRLSHPNIVRTYEFGEWQGRRFITMELLDGRDLSQLLLIAQGPLELDRGLRLMEDACEGLSAAHRVGVIHRDIKPHNMFVVQEGETLKIMDFGIAKTDDITLTVPGTDRVLGTPAYLSPERLKDNAELSARTDIYSLGVVMFQVFTGRLPFMGPDISSLLTSIVLDEPPRPTDLIAGFPAALERTILKAMAHEPVDRHPSCDAIAAELRTLRSA